MVVVAGNHASMASAAETSVLSNTNSWNSSDTSKHNPFSLLIFLFVSQLLIAYNVYFCVFVCKNAPILKTWLMSDF